MFQNRQDAARRLSLLLQDYANAPSTLVIALPRGGVVLGAVIAAHLHLPLDVLCVRKMGAPDQPEFALGAVSETGECLLSKDIQSISPAYLEKTIEKEKIECQRRAALYRQNRPLKDIKGKTVILVDDGVATGSTLFVAIASLKKRGVSKLCVAVPVAPPDTFQRIKQETSQAFALATPSPFYAVSQFYERFEQTADEEVIALLQTAAFQK